jgi:hypothetical protein
MQAQDDLETIRLRRHSFQRTEDSALPPQAGMWTFN